ncbi:MAG TPA: carboxypeptidase-like regulatory domain-containing protein, partial [Bacteroidales bacterium]|nr:carboxypeptidase-like regulatory domain-containing protein [Bacteroidales bacterium]
QRGSLRRVDRSKMQRLLSEATVMLRGELDWMVEKYKSTSPVLYERYRMLRQVKKGSGTTTAVFTELSGTVTDALSGEAIRGASVQFLDVSGFDATTDADGYYLIDDLIPGSYQLRCTAPGYQSTNDVAFTIVKGESLEVNFSLTAQQAVA